MRRSIPIPAIGLIGLLLATDGIVSWLAGATPLSWGLPWTLGTAVLLGALLRRIGRSWKIALGAGAVLAILIGVLLYFKGAAITAVRLDNVAAILVFLVVFIGEIGVGIATLLSGRASAQGANLWVYVVAGLVVVILLNYVSARHLRQRVDLTQQKLESLSDQTLAKLRSLKEDVHVVAFFRDNDQRRSGYADMLEKYSDASRRFSFEFVDPDKYPDVAARENVNPQGISIVVKAGARREMVIGPEERELTGALLKVTQAGQKVVYFSAWHGERSLQNDVATLRGYLEQLNLGVREHKLSEGDIPSDCAVFIIAGPQTPFVPIEVERLERYLGEGNSLLVLLDADTVATGLEDLLAKYGASVQPNIIVERQRGLVPYAGGLYMGEQQSLYARVRRYTTHDIVKDLEARGIPVGFYQAREVRWVPPDPILQEASGEAFIFAGTSLAFAEPDVATVLRNPRQALNSEGKAPGPFPIAVAAMAKPTDPLAPAGLKTRLVVIGDSDFATDRAIAQEQGNLDLVINAVNWLAQDEDLIAIQPRELGAKALFLTASQGTFVFLFSVWRFPALVLVAGMIVWWYRRSRGPRTRTS